MAIDGPEITSDVLAARPKLFSAAEALRGALSIAADLLLPPVCISCRNRVGAHGLLCGECCASPLRSAQGSACRCLTIPASRAFAPRPSPKPVYDRARAAARFSSTMRDLIQSFKYVDQHVGAPLFGRWMAAAGASCSPTPKSPQARPPRLAPGAEAGRGLAGRRPRARESRGTFGAAAIVWNFLAAPLTYRNRTRPNGRSSGTSMTRVVLYTTPYCGYCRAAKHLLGKRGVTFTEIDVSEDLERRREMIERALGRRTVPQIWINDTHVGGYDELAELELAEKLDELLAEADAVAAAVPGE
jgi:glutaredoxin 3